MWHRLAFIALCMVLCSPLSADAVTGGAIVHRVKNCEIELEMLKNSISSQEQARDALEREVSQLLKATRDALNDSKEGTVQRHGQWEKSLEKVVQDCKQLKAHANDLSKTINELVQTVHGLKEVSTQQGQALKELEHAMRAITVAMGGVSEKGAKRYIVKNGDSLEKIAKAHSMSVADLREYNALQQSVIHPGQELRVR